MISFFVVMKICLIFFSPTKNTAQIADVIKEVLVERNIDVDLQDITPYAERQKKFNSQDYDAFFFGFPIHVQRVPSIIRDWIQSLNGCGKDCSVFFTYGGVTTGVAHYDTKKRLEKQNFHLISTAEFLGKHTFNIGGWNLMPDRPNEQDFSVARAYTIKTLEKIASHDTQLTGFEVPKITEKQLNRLDKVPKGGMIPPSRNGKDCCMCLKCEIECPNNAMDAEAGISDGEKCIRCLRCVSICPDTVLEINDMRPAYSVIVSTEISPEKLAMKESKFFL